MVTTAIGIENLCVPCRSRCRYCLLSWDGGVPGVEYRRGERFAARFLDELGRERPHLGRFYYIGYCMDTPHLTDYIRFCQGVGSPAGTFLQLNGLALRDREQTERFAEAIAAAGIKTADVTFYGQQAYHDSFAGRPGDFAFLLRLAEAAAQAGIEVTASLPVIRENMAQLPALLDQLEALPIKRFFAFFPHGKGRGWALNGQRLTRAEFEALPDRVRACFSPRVEYRTEADWLRRGDWPQPESRTLTLSLTPDNIARLEQTPALEIVQALEALDERYYGFLPPPASLAARWGDPAGEKMYRLRDLLLEYRQRHYRRYGAGMPNMDDESGHFSVRS